MADIDRARDRATSALDALNRAEDDHTPSYWVGWLSSALEGVIFDLKAGV
jgi:hypothetical protein